MNKQTAWQMLVLLYFINCHPLMRLLGLLIADQFVMAPDMWVSEKDY